MPTPALNQPLGLSRAGFRRCLAEWQTATEGTDGIPTESVACIDLEISKNRAFDGHDTKALCLLPLVIETLSISTTVPSLPLNAIPPVKVDSRQRELFFTVLPLIYAFPDVKTPMPAPPEPVT